MNTNQSKSINSGAHNRSCLSLYLLNNNNLVSGSEDTSVKIWSPNNEFRFRNNLLGHTGPINDLLFLNNGDLASCSSDHSIRVWDMNTNKVKSINSQAHNRSCLSLYLMNNNILVSSSEDKSIRLWNTNLFYNISIIKGYSSSNNDIQSIA
jgi:WD40 repeat protein